MGTFIQMRLGNNERHSGREGDAFCLPRYPCGVVASVTFGCLFAIAQVRGSTDNGTRGSFPTNGFTFPFEVAFPFLVEALVWCVARCVHTTHKQTPTHVAVLGLSCTALAIYATGNVFVNPWIASVSGALALSIGRDLVRVLARLF